MRQSQYRTCGILALFLCAALLLTLASCTGNPLGAPLDETQPALTEPETATTEPETEPETMLETIPETEASEISAEQAYAGIIDAYFEYMRLGKLNGTSIEVLDQRRSGLFESVYAQLGPMDEQREWELLCSGGELRENAPFYSLFDINKDGIAELIILSGDEYIELPEDNYYIRTVFTLDDGVPMLVGGYWPRHRCVIDQTGTFFIQSSNGASDNFSATYLLKPASAELELIEMVGVESYIEQTGDTVTYCRHYRVKDGEKTIISEDEAYLTWQGFPDVYANNPTKDSGMIFVYFEE